MKSKEQKKENIENEFQILLNKAKLIYPNIEEVICTSNNMTAQTINLQDYLNLTFQTPSTISTNHILIS